MYVLNNKHKSARALYFRYASAGFITLSGEITILNGFFQIDIKELLSFRTEREREDKTGRKELHMVLW